MPISSSLPKVSIVIINLDGEKTLSSCLNSLGHIDYPKNRLEIILVDNGSKDDSLRLVRKTFPEVRVIENGQNLGFAVANNIGVKNCDGELVAFLNNDARVEKSWLSELVKPVMRDDMVASTGSKIFSWDGKTIDYGGGGTNFHGIAFKEGYREPDSKRFGYEKPVLFATGASMLIYREVFLKAGGFDEDYFAYYEDIDLGWRLWILGYKVLYIPTSIAYHHHSRTSQRIGIEKLRVLHIRNPLYTIIKNYGQDVLDKILAAALLLSIKRTLLLARINDSSFRINPKDSFESSFIRLWRKWPSFPLPKVACSDLIAYSDVLSNLPKLLEKRKWIQNRRKREDKDIFELFVNPHWSAESAEEYHSLQDLIEEWLGIKSLFSS